MLQKSHNGQFHLSGAWGLPLARRSQGLAAMKSIPALATEAFSFQLSQDLAAVILFCLQGLTLSTAILSYLSANDFAADDLAEIFAHLN